MSNAATPTLSQARRLVSLALRGVELPDCFAVATVNAALNSIDRNTVSAKASRRRLADKALRVSGAL